MIAFVLTLDLATVSKAFLKGKVRTSWETLSAIKRRLADTAVLAEKTLRSGLLTSGTPSVPQPSQAVLRALVFSSELLIYFLFAPMVDARWLRFAMTTLYWAIVHASDG